ncbi:MAG TPA: DinB family protein [Pirellulaceae bacterium]|mgnify:CR=1 FL=1|nr:DinB family protein [Pirellulaceae bacterium]HMO91738.1 DinB family protein [Pirellulaceae bacterium]HMP69799.1 DinB family protein [Pirellulaceae bacterium]
MGRIIVDTLQWQYNLTWQLASEYHLSSLSDEECHWQPAENCWAVFQLPDGTWGHDWADEEPASAPSVTIGWITWQIIWWWSGLLASYKRELPPDHQAVKWPENAAGVRATLHELHTQWSEILAELCDNDLEQGFSFPWPEPQPFRLAIAWSNSELMKNVAEIGILRHCYQNRK